MEPTRQEFLHISQPEKILFYFLVYASLAYMAWQIAQCVRSWRQGRPIDTLRPGWKYWLPTRAAAAKWLGNVLSYVLLQKKVRSSRPKSGAPMHLMIFYGFVSLVLATTLLAINTYGPVKFHHGTYYLVYETAFDLLGLLLVVGVGWAFVRRAMALGKELGAAALREPDPEQAAKQAVDRRRWPMSHSMNDFWTLGLLLVIGLTGYWLEACRISLDTRSFDSASIVGFLWAKAQGPVSVGLYRFAWWFHMVWIFVFFAVIPKMRLRHIVMAIASTAGKPERPMGHLRTIPMEEVEQTEQVGVKLAKDYSRWHLMSLDACMECGRCTEVCPAWNVGKVLNPKQVVQDIRGALRDGTEVAAAVSEEALWACTTCNACVEACPVLIRHVDLIVDSRRNLVSEGALSGPAATMLRQTASTSNAWGQPASNREDWMKGLEIPLCRDGVEFEYLFWVGCAGATDPGAIKTTKAVAELLTKAGVKFACLGREEACTGDPARRVGEEFLFQDKAAQNAATFEKYGVKKVVTTCPHCLNTLKNEYGEYGASMEVFHHSQLLQQLVRKGDLVAAKPPKGEVVYHDPCYLSRVNEESEAPREVVAGMSDPEHKGKKTLCCGAGGGRMWMEEPPSQRPANRRTEELLATGATTVAVACPFCRIMLGDSIKQARPNDEIRLLDLAEMLQEANTTGVTP
ncbi:(Fe-S)-binding protein [Fimbriimonas ginsengisoli]|uniref:Fe-S oxidoreductase n=1 Tax=Fimbriimonas ginsengisoli Gsoil 348 TaxID=661478 RepID=A0A068NU83_FIMGI|nr:(Fe-S)-binding protein [Fimbriimonas ginsengisoli]AIE85164.1 Fe-S oxidoreductase [Fimbriimonas ginsengisoli Gsoil 348]